MMLLLPLLLLQLLAWPAAEATTRPDDIGKVVYIRPPYGPDDMQLRQALSDPDVGSVVFTTDYNVGQQFSDYSGPFKEETPILLINRNVTFTGLAGQQPLLDFDFNLSVLELCNICTFTITDMAIANERRGANAQLDFFLGRGGSVLNLTNVVRKRLSCTSIEPALRLVRHTQRSLRFPAGNGSKEQVYAADDITFRGKDYPRTLHLQDYSVEFPRHYNGGYSLVLLNVYRMCDNFVDDSCLENRDADQCVYEHISRLQGPKSSRADSGTAAAAGLSAGAIAGIAIAAAVAAAAVAVLLWLLVMRRRAASNLPLAFASSKDAEVGAAAAAGGKSEGHLGSLSGTSPNDSSTAATSRICAGRHISAEGHTQHTTSSSSNTTPLEPAPGVVAAAYDLQFGALLGSGSFGRVYRGRWKDRDVAVKVIEHDSRMAAAVANEVQLMLNCNHPNVVRAFHYISHVQQRSTAKSTAAAAASNVSGRLGSSTEYGPAADSGSLGMQSQPQQQRRGSSGDAVPRIGSSTDQQQQHHQRRPSGGRVSSVAAMQQLLAQNVHRQGSSGSGSAAAAAAAAEHALHRQQQQQREELLQFQDKQQEQQQQLEQLPPHHHQQQQHDPLPLNQQQQQQQHDPLPLNQQQRQHDQLPLSQQQHDPLPLNQQQQQQQDKLLPDQQQQQQQEWRLKSGLLGHDYPPALPQTPNSSSTGGGRVVALGFGPYELADEEQWENVKTWLIQEFCDSGTLAKMSGGWLPSNEDDAQMLKRLVMLQDVAQGLRYLHSRNVVHGDLNARNVLITSSASSVSGFAAKLADLGLSRTIKQHATHHTTCTVGTMSHMPPELLRYGRMSTNVDIYSFGVMMWEMYCREVAFRELHYGQFFEYVVLRDLRPKVPPFMPEDYSLLMQRCWSTDPGDRPSSSMVCECLALMIADRQQALGLAEPPGSASCSSSHKVVPPDAAHL